MFSWLNRSSLKGFFNSYNPLSGCVCEIIPTLSCLISCEGHDRGSCQHIFRPVIPINASYIFCSDQDGRLSERFFWKHSCIFKTWGLCTEINQSCTLGLYDSFIVTIQMNHLFAVKSFYSILSIYSNVPLGRGKIVSVQGESQTIDLVSVYKKR